MPISFEENEHVILEVRRHWFVLAIRVLFAFLLALAPVFLYATVLGLLGDFPNDGDGRMANATFSHLLLFFYFFWLLLLWIYIFVSWTNYFLDIWVVTNKKIMAIEQKGLFRREVSSLALSKVQNVNSDVHGIIETLLNFGDLHVETAGGMRVFIIRDATKPGDARQKLNEIIGLHVPDNNLDSASSVDN